MGKTGGPRSQRFPKSRRLVRTAQFARVRTEGRTFRGALLTLGTLEVDEAAQWEIGFVTSRRIGGAVVRNRVRRRLREIIRRSERPLQEGYWLALIARPAAARATFQELKDEWLRLAERASILAP